MIDTDDVTPITYVNSAASLKAFCGRHGGIVCTSANARAVLDWAFARTQPRAVLSRPAPGPQHGPGDGHPAGRRCRSGTRTQDALGGNTPEAIAPQPRDPLARAIAASTRCSCPQHVDQFRAEVPRHQDPGPSRVHDGSGRPGRRGRLDRQDHPRRSKRPRPARKWAIGTELHLVNRLKHEHPEQEIHFLSPVVCMCATMYRIDLAHLCWALENLAAGTPVNVIEVDDETARWSLVALRADAGSEMRDDVKCRHMKFE